MKSSINVHPHREDKGLMATCSPERPSKPVLQHGTRTQGTRDAQRLLAASPRTREGGSGSAATPGGGVGCPGGAAASALASGERAGFDACGQDPSCHGLARSFSSALACCHCRGLPWTRCAGSLQAHRVLVLVSRSGWCRVVSRRAHGGTFDLTRANECRGKARRVKKPADLPRRRRPRRRRRRRRRPGSAAQTCARAGARAHRRWAGPPAPC